MLVIQVSEFDKKRKKIRLENGESFLLYKGELRRFSIREGEELEQVDYEKIIEEVLKKRALKRSLNLLVVRDYTKVTLEEKLQKGGYPKEVIDETISAMVTQGYIDHRRYATNYYRQHKDKKSVREIEQALYFKGIDKEEFEEYIVVDEDEISVIEKCLIRKYYSKANKKNELLTLDEKLEKVLSYILEESLEQKAKGFLYTKGFQKRDIEAVFEKERW